jgi:DNA-binding LytR/AlgR family response regulator
MIKAIALDDEPPALTVLQHYCSRAAGSISLMEAFTSIKAARRYLESEVPDLIFLDIHMPALSGLDLAAQLDRRTQVIFTTAHSEYALDGFNLNAVDYLLKPYTFERFEQAIEKARLVLQARATAPRIEGHVLLRVEYALVKVELNDILFIEGLDDYVKVHLEGARPLLVRMTLKAMEEKLPDAFLRVHRSYIVSLPKIEAVRNKNIQVKGQEIPVGSRYEELFFRRYR